MEEVIDIEFKQIISKMKPHAKNLPQKSEERSKVTAWIKKLLAVKSEKVERNEYAKLLLQILKSGHLEPPFSSDPPHGLLPRLNTFTPITVAPRTQSTSFYQETRKSNTDSRQKPTRKSPGRSYKEHRRSKSSEHTQFQPIPEAPFTQRSTSPLYLVQTNVTGGARGYGHSSLRDGQSHVSDGGLWNLGSGPSFLHRHSPQASRYETRSPQFKVDRELEDLLRASPAPSDDILGSDDSQFSDVSELLMERSERWSKSPKRSEKRQSFMFPQSPQKAFTSSALLSPSRADITRDVLHSREIELRLKAAENQFEEEKRKIKQNYEESLKRIFDRKNNEVESLRTECQLNKSQYSTQVMRLEMKLAQSLKENKTLREEGSQSLTDSRQYRRKLEAQFEEKLHTVVSEFERSKLELEEHHSKAHHRLVEEMGSRLTSINDEHTAQRRADSELISSLKTKLAEVNRDYESLTQAHSQLNQNKVKLEEQCSSLEAELKTAQERVEGVETELLTTKEDCAQQLGSLREEKESQLRELRARTEQSLSTMQHEHTVQESKMCESIAELKERVGEMEREMSRAREEQALKLTELETESQRALRQKDLEHDKRVIELKREGNERELEGKERLAALEAEIKSRDNQLEIFRRSMDIHSRQAEKAIEEFKTEVEQQTSGMFDQMKNELVSLEKELASVRAQRASEREQFLLEKEESRAQAETEREKIEQTHRQSVEELRNNHKAAMEVQRREIERSKEEVIAKFSSDLTQLQAQSAAKDSHNRKVIGSLECEVRGLKEEMDSMSQHHSAELEEMSRRGREEVTTAVRIHEAAIGKLRSQLDTQKSRIREEHKRELSALTDKHNHQLRQLEHQFSLKDSQSIEAIASLKAQIQFLEENLEKQQKSHEDHMREVMRRNSEEISSMKQHHDSIRQSLTEEAEAAHTTVSQHQERNRHQLAEHNAKLSQLKRSYEERLRGMLPSAMKQEYEETIKSLRAQINILQQRAGVLQDELDQRYSSHKRSSKQYKNT